MLRAGWFLSYLNRHRNNSAGRRKGRHPTHTFRGTTKLSGSMELDVSLRSLAVSHFITLRPRLGIMAIPLAAVVDRNSLMEKHHGFSSTHCVFVSKVRT